MAHFAELDDQNNVIRVVVVSNSDIVDDQNCESEELGLRFCEKLFGGRWIQTSYNGTFRKRYAGIGSSYLPEHDVFVGSKPAEWYVLDDNFEWVCPVGIHPQTGETLTSEQWLWLEKLFAVDSPIGIRSVFLG